MTSPLLGQRILVTRPEAQSQVLSNLIEQAGGKPISFPVINIEPLPPESWNTLQLDSVDWLIFVSPNAVECFKRGWRQALPGQLKMAAVGQGTANAMREAGLRVDCQPLRSTGSEGLLQKPEMQDVAGKQIVIVRADGGRALLADTLTARGATMRYVAVYRRTATRYERQDCLRAMEADKLICTSVAGVDNLCEILADYHSDLFSKPLVVVSERIRAYALALGFRRVVVSDEASDTAVLNTLIEMDKQHGK